MKQPVFNSFRSIQPHCHRKRGLGLLVVLLCIITAQSGDLQAQYTTVPLFHQVYPLLRRGETLGLFSSTALRVLPLARQDVLSLLHEMHHQRQRLSTADQQLLDQMLAEFTDPAPGEPAAPEGEIHAYRFQEGQTQFFVDLQGTQSFRFSRNRFDAEDETLSETLAAGAIRGNLGRHLNFYARARNTMILGKKDAQQNFDPGLGQIQTTTGAALFNDQATGYLTGALGRFSFLMGRNRIAWGSGMNEHLALSSENQPLDLVQLSLQFRRFRFTYLHAGLQGIADRRFVAGHRVDVQWSARFQTGVYETVIYGNRGPEAGYLNPLLIYHIMEHHLGDRDNNTFGIDFSYLAQPGVRLFGEIFVDDLSFDRSLFGHWGNKLAYLFGVHWVQPLCWQTGEMSLSYTRVDPYVYTHFDSVNVYSHYGESLGSRIGPNADRLQLRVGWQPHRDFRMQFGHAFLRRGQGSLFRPHRPEDGERKGFLAGIVEYRHEWELTLRNQLRRDVFLGLSLRVVNRVNAGFNAGVNRLERFAAFFLDIHY